MENQVFPEIGLDTIVRVGRSLANSGYSEAALWVGLCKDTFVDDELISATLKVRIAGRTRLIVVCAIGCEWRVQQLLRDDKGRVRPSVALNDDMYAENEFSQPGTPLQAAAEAGHVNTARLLLDAGAEPDECQLLDGAPIMRAARNKNEEVIALLREAGASLSLDDGDIFVSALAAACTEATNVASMSAAQQAEAEAKALRLVDSLLAAGQPANGTHPWANENVEDDDDEVEEGPYPSDVPLIMAASWSAPLVRRLIAAGADVDVRDNSGSTALHNAGSGEVVRALIEAGADLYAMNGEGVTPLFGASLDVSTALLDAGHDPNYRDVGNHTPIYFANSGEVVRLLVSRRADVNAAYSNERDTALHHAMCSAATHPTEVCRALLQAGASPHSRDDMGCTALHFLAMGQRSSAGDSVELADMLLSAGADVNAVCNAGLSPLASVGSVEMADILLQRGASADTMDVDRLITGVHNSDGIESFMPSAAEVIRRLRLAGAPPGSLISATRTGSVAVVEAMLEDLPGVPPSRVNVTLASTRKSPVHIAAKTLNPALLRVVLNAVSRSIARRPDMDGFTALHSFAWAYIQRSDSASPDDFMATATEIVGMLRDAGISLGAQENLGRTACDIIELSNGQNDPVARLLDGREP